MLRLEKHNSPGRSGISVSASESSSISSGHSKQLCCAICRHQVTDEKSVIFVDGLHVHYRENPQQQRFAFRCFSDANGCRIDGVPVAEHSWFNGCRWQIAVCAQCNSQLGWFFSGEQNFYALIEEQLVGCDTSI